MVVGTAKSRVINIGDIDEEEENRPSTGRKTIGTVPVERVQKMKEAQAFFQASKAFSEAKRNSQIAKTAFRNALKKQSSQLRSIENLDFIVSPDAKTLTLFEVSKASRRSRASNEIEFD
jgi:hypothetical protein